MRMVYREFAGAVVAALFVSGLAHGQGAMYAAPGETPTWSSTSFGPLLPAARRPDSAAWYSTDAAAPRWDPWASSAGEMTNLTLAPREPPSRGATAAWMGTSTSSGLPAGDHPPESYGFTAQLPVPRGGDSWGWSNPPMEPNGYLREESMASSSILLESANYPRRGGSFRARLHGGMRRSWTDHHHYYACDTLYPLLLGLGASGVVANTSLDQDFQDWYQDDVRSRGLDGFSDFWRPIGNGYLFIPIYLGLSAAYGMYEDGPCGGLVAEFSDRATRSYLVGVPPMLAMQFLLGSSRPGETRHASRWSPFGDTNAVSGHAFVGAVPFITAAQMTDSRPLKTALYLCSTLPAWSRMNDNRHYLSQVFLGWWLAYLACGSVERTELAYSRLTFSPIASSEMIGLAMVYQR